MTASAIPCAASNSRRFPSCRNLQLFWENIFCVQALPLIWFLRHSFGIKQFLTQHVRRSSITWRWSCEDGNNYSKQVRSMWNYILCYFILFIANESERVAIELKFIDNRSNLSIYFIFPFLKDEQASISTIIPAIPSQHLTALLYPWYFAMMTILRKLKDAASTSYVHNIRLIFELSSRTAHTTDISFANIRFRTL